MGEYYMKKKYLIPILIIAIIVIISCIIIVKFKDQSLTNNKLQISNKVSEYSLTRSDIPGIPFTIDCNFNQIEININNGKIIEAKEVELVKNGEYIVKCNTTIYWSPLDDNVNSYDNTTNIKFYDKEHIVVKEYEINKSNDNKYYVTTIN